MFYYFFQLDEFLLDNYPLGFAWLVQYYVVMFLFLEDCGARESLRTTTCPKTVVGEARAYSL